ncbi:MAG: hypothetical protein EOR52_05775 [Mesorhizobium sp.]|uniref:AAA family ATPase n=1 Tax=Mesorhizobium sp. TaxID=1871066 RepID=UPI000FE9A0E9|nr:AAA family ATPase [Mesorhizobium sp.]RWK91039.1 MAG: hypothetical protein EOR52_05775 [Mesorhizobium sp.]
MSTSFCATVVIATTTKPVWIIGLSELSGGFSTIGIDRKTESQSKIAQKYKLFVQQPTGLIHQLFDREPYPVYRMDISDEIQAGFSWQLPILLAHALRADGGRLAFKDQPDSAIIWASGEVKADFTVAPVGDIAEKLRNSRPLFEAALVEGRPVFVFVPAENAADIDPDIGQWLEERQVAIHLVAHLNAVFSTLSLPGLTLAASKPPARTPAFSGNPYRGLEAYGREHRPLFFGRGRAREEALKRLHDAVGHYRPFLLIHGQSGVGKSSLVQAGLVGDIEEGGPAEGGFRLAVVTPSEGGGDPAAVLCQALKVLLGDRQPVPEAANEADETLLLLDRLRNQPDVARRLIVIDQLEEIFDPAIAPTAVQAFGLVLDRIVSSRLVWVIATIRSDALGLLDRSPTLSRLGRDERVWRLERPSRYELSEIITEPLALAGKSFSDRLIPEQFADLAAQSPDSLPLLQTVLYRFYEQAGSKKQLTAESLDHIGGFEGALGVWAEEVREQMLAQGIAADDIDRVLVSLVRIEPETRRTLSRSIPYRHSKLGDGECNEDKDSKSVPRNEAAILEHLVKGRLASTYGAEDGPRIRLAHEILITHWPHLKTLAERLSAAMLTRDDLEQRTKAWLGANRNEAELLRGPKLDEARVFVNESLVVLGDEVRHYVGHSLQADEKAKKEKRRLRFILGSAVATVVVLLVVAGYNFIQSHISETGRKTASAYVEANMARRALVAGHRREAIETTERALSSDLPFLPDFYDILYNSVYRLSKMELELSKDEHSDDGETLRLKNGLLATSTTEMVTIWSPLDGILSTRKVSSSRTGPRLSLDGSTLFVREGRSDLFRFRSSSSSWDRFMFQFYLDNYVALDEDTLIACDGDEIVRIELGQAGEDTAIALRKPLNQCDAVEASDGRFFVTTRVDDRASAIRLYDLNPDTLQIGQEYDTRRIRWDNHIPLLGGLRGGLYSLDGFITLSDGIAAYEQTIYEPGKPVPLLQIENDGRRPSVSADRSRIAWEGSWQISVFDVKTRDQVVIPCDCRLIGFRDDRTILANRGSEIVGVSVDTPLKQTLLTKLAKNPSYVVQLPDKAGILAVNTYGPEEVVLRSELQDGQMETFSIPEGEQISDVRFVGADEILIETFQHGDDVDNGDDVVRRFEHRYHLGIGGAQLADAQGRVSREQDRLNPGSAETQDSKGQFDSSKLGRLVFRRDETSEEHVLASGVGEVSATTFIPGRDIVVAGFQNGDITAWQLANDSSPILTVSGHDGSVSGVLANPSGTAFISWDLQNVKVWPLPTLEKLRQVARELGP